MKETKVKKISWKITITMQNIVIMVAGIMFNIVGMTLCAKFQLPIRIDTVGTIFSAMLLGPAIGMIVGGISGAGASVFNILNLFSIISNLIIGVLVGIYSEDGNEDDDYYNNLLLVIVLTFVCVIVSALVNLAFRDGYMDNKWGDGMHDLLEKRGFSQVSCAYISALFIEFPDKFVSMIIAMIICRAGRSIKTDQAIGSKHYSLVLALIVGTIMYAGSGINAQAQEVTMNNYQPFVFNMKNGLSSHEVTAILQSVDGYIWVGSYSGLMKYDGVSFKKTEVGEHIKSVTALYEDSDGMLWIGTNDNGLACYNNSTGDIVYYTVGDGLASNSIRSIIEDRYGNIIVGTVSKISVIRVDGKIVTMEDFDNLIVVMDMCITDDNTILGITNSGILFEIKDTANLKNVRICNVDFECDCTMTSLASDNVGTILIGTSEGEIYEAKSPFSEAQKWLTGIPELGSVSCINYDSATCGWLVGGRNTFGYVSRTGNYTDLSVDSFSHSATDAFMDSQGNIWVASDKDGLCKYSESPFSNVFEGPGIEDEPTVNAITYWNGNMLYGCESGIIAIDSENDTVVEIPQFNELAEDRIRNFFVDSNNNLWICTYGNQGLVFVDPDYNIKTYNQTNSNTMGSKFRSVIELSDGTILAASNVGLTFIKNGLVERTIGERDGLKMPQILSMVESDNGVILAASDGDGIYEIANGRVIGNIGEEQGLNSLVVLRIVPCKDGYLYITSNAIYYDDGLNIRKLDNFPYSNNYDAYISDDNVVWISSSAGIYLVNLDDLLSNTEYYYLLLDTYRGFDKTANANSWNYVDRNGYIYICTTTGATKVSLKEYNQFDSQYDVLVSCLNVDGEDIFPDASGTYNIPAGANRITISPAILNFELVNPILHIYLEGFDNQGITLHQNETEDIVYTNLPHGEYILHIQVLNEMNQELIKDATFSISKAASFYETRLFETYLVVVVILAIIYITWIVAKYLMMATVKKQKEEIALAKQEAEMSFQAVKALASIIDAKDDYTRGHSVRVAGYSVLLAEKLGWSSRYVTQIRYAALLHDIGKIGIPDRILNKPGKLSEDEYRIIKLHCMIGGDILKNMPYLLDASDIARHHHERFDGTGYPDGLKGLEIPASSRIVCIADAYDAMSSRRIYRNPLPRDVIRDELINGKGTQFDPEFLDAFVELFDKGALNPKLLKYEDEIKLPESYLNQGMGVNAMNETELMLSQMVDMIKTSGSYTGALDIEYFEFSRLHEFLTNMSARYRFNGHLLLITLKCREGTTLRNSDFDKAGTCMDYAICNTIRTTDACSRFSRNQFLVIMMEAGYDNIQSVVDRIFSAYYKNYGDNSVVATYEAVAINESDAAKE